MADDATDQPAEELEPTEIEEEQPEAPEEEQPEAEEPTAEEDDALVVTIDGEDAPVEDEPADNNVIRTLRQQLREEQKKRKELEQKTAPPPIEVGERPTLESCGYDEDQLAEELIAWKDRKDKAEAQQEAARKQQEEASQSFEAAKTRFAEERVKLGAADFEEAQAKVDEALGHIAPVILLATNRPAEVVYALGKSPARLAELAKIKNPFELAAAIGRMEGGIQVKRRTPPAPESKVRGGGVPIRGNAALDAAKKRAEATGDYSAYFDLKRSLSK